MLLEMLLETRPILNPFEQLAEALDHRGIAYCHWKGNYALDEVMAGRKDLDLLIERGAAFDAAQILADLGFKRAIGADDERCGAICHYYGADPQTGTLFHVHLYTSLFTGETFINSHWLPLEAMLLDHTERIGPMRVPVRSAELVVQVLRTFIKYGSLLDQPFLAREYDERLAEIRWLRSESDRSEAVRLLHDYFPAISEQLFIDCVNALAMPTPLRRRLALARQVRHRLRGTERLSEPERWWATARAIWHGVTRRLLRRSNRKTLATGGAIIAFVGPEATGKSTLTEECARWLGSEFRVRTIHAGKPPASPLTAPVNRLLPFLRKRFPELKRAVQGPGTGGQGSGVREYRTDRSDLTDRPHPHTPTRPHATSPFALLRAIRAVGVAWDRRRLLRQAKRWAANGEIVISDRYPSNSVGAMDSPRLEEAIGRGPLVVVYNRLVALERRLYREIPPPDVVLRLTVPIETAKQRNRDRIKIDKESDDYVEARHRLSHGWSREGTRSIFDISTVFSLGETIQLVKYKIWEVL